MLSASSTEPGSGAWPFRLLPLGPFDSLRLSMLVLWPWLAIYVVVAGGLFLWFRRVGATDLEVAARARRGGSPSTRGGSPSTLGEAAREFFAFSSPVLLALTVVASLTFRTWIGPLTWQDFAVAAGVAVFWPIQEWLIHSLLLHMRPFHLLGVKIDPILARNHRNHHRLPSAPELGVTPLFIVWFYLATIPVLWQMVLPIPQAVTGSAAFFSLALYYEWIHFLIHTAYPPRTWLYRRLWRNHRLHHYKSDHFWFGVTTLTGDWLFGTRPPPATVHKQKSETDGLEIGEAGD